MWATWHSRLLRNDVVEKRLLDNVSFHYWKQVHHRIDGQRLEALLMWPEIVAVLGARPSTWGLEVQCGLVHASFQRFCMRSRDLIMRCIVYWEVWRIYLFYTLLWILRESTRAFGLNRRYSHWVWHCDRSDPLRRYEWDEELWDSSGTAYSVWLRRSVFMRQDASALWG